MTMTINIAEFWKELDAKLDARFATIDARLSSIEKRITHIQNWTVRQDNVLERESTIAIYNYLRTKVTGSYVVCPNNGFPRRIPGANGEITEMDGVVILTTNPKYEAQIAAKQIATGFVYKLVIIEAKQHLTLQKYNRKIKQRSQIEALLKDANNIPQSLKDFGFDKFDHEVGLYFGSNDVDPAVLPRLQQDAAANPWMGWLDLSGARYIVKDANNSYGEALEGYSFVRGGRRGHLKPSASK